VEQYYGGVMTLVSKALRNNTSTIHSDERFNIVKIFDRLFINVYLPCSGSNNRLTACSDLLADIWSWREHYNDCECVIAGEFNTAMDSNDVVALRLNDFVNSCSLVRCDDLFPSQKVNTYVNLSRVLILMMSRVLEFLILMLIFPIIYHFSLNCQFLILQGLIRVCDSRVRQGYVGTRLTADRIVPILGITCSQWEHFLRI